MDLARAVEGMGVEVARIRGRGSRRGKLQRSKLSDGLLRPWRGGAAPDVLALVLRGHPHSPPWRGRVLRLRGAFEWFQRVADEVVPERRILAPCAEGDDVQASEHEPGRRFGGVEALTDVVAAVGRLPKKRLVFFSPLRRLVRFALLVMDGFFPVVATVGRLVLRRDLKGRGRRRVR